MDRMTELFYELRQVQRKLKSVEGSINWYLDNRPDELESDPEYQELEQEAVNLCAQERNLRRQINEQDEIGAELAAAMN